MKKLSSCYAVQSAVSLIYRFRNFLLSQLAELPLQRNLLTKKTRRFFSQNPPDSAEYNLFSAFEAFFSNSIYAEHNKYIRQIESLRKTLLEDKTIITRHDFGAGLSKNLYKHSQNTSVGKLCKGSSMPKELAHLLYTIVYHTKPQVVIELGTCLGISGAYLATAQQLAIKNGRFVTLEGDPSSAAIAEKNFNLLQLYNTEVKTGRFADTLPGVLNEANRIDFALIDGHHNGPATLQYYNQIKPYLSQNSILVFDDIDWSADMQSAWKTLSILPELYICINLGRTGICIFSSRHLPKQQLYLPL